MLSRDEYDRVIQVFLVELNHLCKNASENELQKVPRLSSEIASYLGDLRDPARDAAQTLYTAFAFLDEYVAADWERIATAAYDAYLLSQMKDGPGAKPA
jgi:hypothetical protein